MTLNDLECAIHLKVRLVDGTLDVRLLQVLDSTIRIGVATGSDGEWAGGPSPPPCGQLTCCFSTVAEVLVFKAAHCRSDRQKLLARVSMSSDHQLLKIHVRR